MGLTHELQQILLDTKHTFTKFSLCTKYVLNTSKNFSLLKTEAIHNNPGARKLAFLQTNAHICSLFGKKSDSYYQKDLIKLPHYKCNLVHVMYNLDVFFWVNFKSFKKILEAYFYGLTTFNQ